MPGRSDRCSLMLLEKLSTKREKILSQKWICSLRMNPRQPRHLIVMIMASGDDEPGPSNVSSEENPVDISDLVEEYTREWVDGLDRDDLMSLSIALHHLLVTVLQLKKTDAYKLIAELIGKRERTVRNGELPSLLLELIGNCC